MTSKKNFGLGIILLIAILLLSVNLSLAYLSPNPQLSQFGIRTFSGADASVCTQAGQDLIVQIAPFGCTPVVVRSDLLEENDVPVFCQLSATQVNLLIDIDAIDRISFTGNYSPEFVSGIGFYPARAVGRASTDFDTSFLGNIGYVVINLKKQANASHMPDSIEGQLTASVKYDVDNAFGTGSGLFYLPEIDEEDWANQKARYVFWNGRGYVRAEDISGNGATLGIYDERGKISSVSLEKGETSGNIYLPGFTCQAGLKLKLNSLEYPDTHAKLKVNEEIVEVAQGESFLENKCSVKNMKNAGLVKKITLRCIEDDKARTFDLIINPKITLKIEGESREASVGDWLYDFTENGKIKSVYLAYVGTQGNSKSEDALFSYLVTSSAKKDALSDSELATLDTLAGSLIEAKQTSNGLIEGVTDLLRGFSGTANRLARFLATGEKLYRISSGESFGAFDKEVSIESFAEPRDIELSGEVKENYENAKEDYETIREQFPADIYNAADSTSYGEQAAYNEIVLSTAAGQKRTVAELCKEFENSYPEKTQPSECSDASKLANSEIDETYVTINNRVKRISFEGIYEPAYDDYGAEILISSAEGSYSYKLNKNKLIYLSNNGGDYVQLVSIDENSARIRASISGAGVMEAIRKEFSSGIVTLEKDVPKEFGSYSVVLADIKSTKVAKVSLIPDIDNKGTAANFSFKIGIEKRAIQLAPEKTKELIDTLNKDITTWQNISNGLGTVVEGLKTGCFVGGAALTAKNLLANTGGAGIARKIVMRGEGGWTEECSDLKFGSLTYNSIEECYQKNEDAIDKDVAVLSKTISEQNADIKKLEDIQGVSKQEALVGRVVDNDAFVEKYLPQVRSCLNDEELNKILTSDGWKANQFSIGQLRDLELYCKTLKSSSSSELRQIAESELGVLVSDVKESSVAYVQISEFANTAGIDAEKISSLVTGKDTVKLQYEGLAGKDLNVDISGVKEDTPVALVQTFPDGKKYIFVLDDSLGTSKLAIKPRETMESGRGLSQASSQFGISGLMIYDSQGNYVENPSSELTNIYFERLGTLDYSNEYGNARLRYYETEPYKGLPALVPFDLKKGWYAYIKQTLPVLANTASYDASGKLSSFYLCNVGENGLEENLGGDDNCRGVNLGTRQPYNQFSGLSKNEAEALIDKAIRAVEAASRISESQRRGTVSILGEKVLVGEPAADVPEFQCQDFMSPKECLLIFNLCDPVICPSSRCDLGGKYPVRNVVETGIIGSVALCLPNIQEGIAVPVCLTGVKAGIDSLLSVKTATRDCLQKSLDTGETVGICDEIQSVYLCDFFWKQAQPIAQLAIPKIIEVVLGQNVRGGGEYLGVADAWQGTEDAINYFTNYYGSTAKEAFLARTTETIQGEFCKSFISGVVPSNGDLLGVLSQPDSPPQFYGRFESLPYTTVTVPPVSQYKVFYHIYSGKDSGAYYQVYLKGDAASSYYRDTAGSLSVASGYIGVGEYASETKDLLAPTGYAELCISVNGREECGFREVTTNLAADFINDKYLESQATGTGITKESACISGSSSIYSLLNPNAQAAAEALINPEIYSQGIIRICATNNPGTSTDLNANNENSRWKDVGYCDTENIRCWIDTESVKNAIEVSTVENETLQKITADYIGILQNKEGYLNEEELSSAIEGIEDEKDAGRKVTLITNIFGNAFWSNDKAKLLLLRGNAYLDLLKVALEKIKEDLSSESAIQKESDAERSIVLACEEYLELGYTSKNNCFENFGKQAGQTTSPSTTPSQEDKPIGVTSPTIPFSEIDDLVERLTVGQLSVERLFVLRATQQLVGEPAVRASKGGEYVNCWDAAYKVYEVARQNLVSQGLSSTGFGNRCSYSDVDGKSYNLDNDRAKNNKGRVTTEIYIGVQKTYKNGRTFPDFAVYTNCDEISAAQAQKLHLLKPGDIISYVWDTKTAHNAVFIGWKDESSNIAYLFDWNGWSADRSLSPKFRYFTEDLSDSKHPVFVIFSPAESSKDSSEGTISDLPTNSQEDLFFTEADASEDTSPESIIMLSEAEANKICGECSKGWISNLREVYCSAAECEFFSIKTDKESDFKCDFISLTGNDLLTRGGTCIAVSEKDYTAFERRAVTKTASQSEIRNSKGTCGYCINALSFEGAHCSREECGLVYDDESLRRFNVGCEFTAHDNADTATILGGTCVSRETETVDARTNAEKAQEICKSCTDSLLAQCTAQMCSSYSSSASQYNFQCHLVNGQCNATVIADDSSSSQSQITSPPQTSGAAKSYIIKSVGFKLGNRLPAVMLYIDANALNLEDVDFVVDSENNCDSVRYQVWEDRLLDRRISEDTPSGDKVSLIRVNAILNSMARGKYHVDAFCFDNSGKVRQKIVSGNFEIK
jgi:hypothetical protein